MISFAELPEHTAKRRGQSRTAFDRWAGRCCDARLKIKDVPQDEVYRGLAIAGTVSVLLLRLVFSLPWSRTKQVAVATIVQCNCGAEYRRTEEKLLAPHTGDAVCVLRGRT